MATSRCLIIFLATTICLLLTHFVAEGGRGYRTKDVLKTVEVEDGVYDCVDFYKQPAFKHPLLKDQIHLYHPEMRPSSRPKWLMADNEVHEEISEIGTVVNCPKGTVPIRKLDNDDQLLEMKRRRFNYSRLGEVHPDDGSNSNSNTYFAVGQSKSGVSRVYNGIAAYLSIFNPKVKSSQYSSGEIIIKGGSDVIITGWTVNPMVYSDDKTRFFIYTIGGDDCHCFNSQCGFITVRSDIPPDFRIGPISTVQGAKYIFPFFVYQDSRNGNWWLETLANNTILGFWPQRFFRGLYKSGNYVACGGEVSGPPDLGYPEMGSSYKPKSSFPEWSYCHDVQVVNEASEVVLMHDLEPYTNQGKHYDVFCTDKRYVMYGGPDSY